MGKKKDAKKAKEQTPQAAASSFIDQYVQWANAVAAKHRAQQEPTQTDEKPGWLLFEMLFDVSSAQSLCAAVHYMDSDFLEEDEAATEAAFQYFLVVARKAAGLLVNGLGEIGVPSNPEVWLDGYENVAAAIAAQLEAEEETEGD